MRAIGVIPARYESTRLPGKPISDICGKPMIWWVYQQAKKVSGLDAVYIATDDSRIMDVCGEYELDAILTSKDNKTHLNRVYEVSQKIDADLYVVICGDEPMVDSKVIEKVIPDESALSEKYVARALMRELTDPAETIDPGNIKISAADNGDCIYLSRVPIPHPYKTVLVKYHKIVGIECYNKAALETYVNHEPSKFEKIEDIALLRFVENRVVVNFTLADTDTLSVDTERDLEKVRKIMSERIARGEI
ncbi:3-deoxy-manno-octulosonate cytidylyltransferase [Clostridia bacterium]|nr:3-deoxy-manno-octulosonate cytidylyltransferase [Clostridia bacterium]